MMKIQVEVNGYWYDTDRETFMKDVRNRRIGRKTRVRVDNWTGFAEEIKGVNFPEGPPAWNPAGNKNAASAAPPPIPFSGNTNPPPIPQYLQNPLNENPKKSVMKPVFITVGIVVGFLFFLMILSAFDSESSDSYVDYEPSYNSEGSYNQYSNYTNSYDDSDNYSSSPQVEYGQNRAGGDYFSVSDGNAGFGIATDGYGNGYIGGADENGAGFFGASDGSNSVGVITDGEGNGVIMYQDQYGNAGIIPVE